MPRLAENPEVGAPVNEGGARPRCQRRGGGGHGPDRGLGPRGGRRRTVRRRAVVPRLQRLLLARTGQRAAPCPSRCGERARPHGPRGLGSREDGIAGSP